MFGLDFAPGLILGLREGLEAFLIIAIMLEYLNKIHRPEHKKDVYIGLPAVINRKGVHHIVKLPLNADETNKLKHSATILRNNLL